MTKLEQYRALTAFINAVGTTGIEASALKLSSFDFGLGKFKEMLLDPKDLRDWTESDKKYLESARDLHKAIETTYKDEYKDVIDSIKNASLTSFFTNEPIVKAMVSSLEKVPFKNILEPSAGTGNYISELSRAFPLAKITAIEKEVLTAAILKERVAAISDKITVINKPLEEDRTKGYDLVISNIPFGDIQVYDSQLYKEANPDKIKASTRIHNYFFVKSLDKLEEGGVVSFLVSSALMDNPGNAKVREFLMKNSDLIAAFRLPDSAFKEEGTQASTDIITLRKNTGKKKSLEIEKAFAANQLIRLERFDSEMNISLDAAGTILSIDNKFTNAFALRKQLDEDENQVQVVGKNIFDFMVVEGDRDEARNEWLQSIQENNKQGSKESIKLKVGEVTNTLNLYVEPSLNPDNTLSGITMSGPVEVSVNLNSYYVGQNSGNLLGQMYADGQYGNDTAVAKLDPEQLQERLFQVIDFTRTSLSGMQSVEEKKQEVSAKQVLVPDGYLEVEEGHRFNPLVGYGNLIIYKGKVGILENQLDKNLVKVYPDLSKDLLKISSFLEVRDTAKQLVEAEISNSPTIEGLREKLNIAYNNFTFTHNYLHKNMNLISLDKDESLLLSLESQKEVDGKKVYERADIFNSRVNGVKAELKASEDLSDGILYSLNAVGKLDLELIASVTGKTIEQVTTEGIKTNMIFFQPNDKLEVNPVTRDEFFSGDIFEKIDLLSNPAVQLPQIDIEEIPDLRFMYINDLTAIQPTPLPLELIDVNMGERWIQDSDYEKFMTHFFEVPCTVKYLPGSKTYFLETREFSRKEYTEMAIEPKQGDTVRGIEIFKNALMNTSPEYTYEVPAPTEEKPEKTKRVKDMNTILLVRSKIDQVKREFREFIQNDAELRERIENKYNRLFNSHILRTYNGSHIKLEGMEGFKAYEHQKNTIWQICQNNGALADQKVGTGKTLVMIGAAVELKRLGIARKPCIAAMKANAAAIARDFTVAYPEAKVLYPRPSDFDPKKREAFFKKIQTNDWDCVILTHEQFGMIPHNESTIAKFINDEIAGLDADSKMVDETVKYSRQKKSALKSMEKKKAALQAKLNMKVDRINKDENLVTFQDMGLDHLFVDESHVFKNLSYTTNFSRVKGLGSPEGSLRATNMLLACRTLQEIHGGDKGVTFLSGTPLSNSLVEMPLLFKYLIPGTLAKMNIDTVDAFLTTFAKKSFDMEFNVAGEIKSTERFREFIKAPEMLNIYRRIANIVTDENFKVEKPTLKTNLVMIKPTEEQLVFNRAIINFVNTRDPAYINRPEMSESELTAFALIATNLSRKASLDMRLINPELEYQPSSKLGIMAANMARIYKETIHFNGTQFMFSDVSTPNVDKFNIYDELKRILIEEHNIPENKVTYIHEHNSDRRRDDLFKEVNKGGIRLVMGSTQKMGTGVNMQERCAAIHHADIPWRPSDRDQRNGRGARQGNLAAKQHLNNEVNEYVYVTEQTLDAYQFDILKNKEQFIKQTKKLNISEINRTIRESDLGEDGAVSARDIAALLSGNNDLIERSKVIKRLESVERMYEMTYSAFNNQLAQSRMEAGLNERNIETTARNIEGLHKDATWLEKNYKVDKEADEETMDIWASAKVVSSQPKIDFSPSTQGATPEEQNSNGITVLEAPEHKKKKLFEYPSPVIIDDKPYTTSEEVGKALQEHMKDIRWSTPAGNTVTVGEYEDRYFIKFTRLDDKQISFRGIPPFTVKVQSKESGVSYTFNNGEINNNEKLAGLYIHRAISKAPTLLENSTRDINGYYSKREGLRKKLEGVYVNEHKEQIAVLKTQLEVIDKRIEATETEKTGKTVKGVNDGPELGQDPGTNLTPTV